MSSLTVLKHTSSLSEKLERTKHTCSVHLSMTHKHWFPVGLVGMNGGEEGQRDELLARGVRLGGRAPVRGERPAPAQDNNEDDPLGLRAMGLVPMMMSDDDDSEDDGDNQDDLDNDEDDQVRPCCTGAVDSVRIQCWCHTQLWPCMNAVLVLTPCFTVALCTRQAYLSCTYFTANWQGLDCNLPHT